VAGNWRQEKLFVKFKAAKANGSALEVGKNGRLLAPVAKKLKAAAEAPSTIMPTRLEQEAVPAEKVVAHMPLGTSMDGGAEPRVRRPGRKAGFES
jgi:hypothetical protein